MRGYIIYSSANEELKREYHEIERFMIEAKKLGLQLEVYGPDHFELVASSSGQMRLLVEGEEKPLPDFVIPRMGSNTTYFALAVIRHFESLGVFVVNSSDSVEMVKDKMYSMQLLAKQNISIPKTMLMKFPFCENHIEVLRKEIGYPMIVKTLSGTQGKGVFLVRDRHHLEDLITLVEQTNPNFNMIIQQFISSSHGRDLRVFTVGGKVIGVMERNAADGGFKANFSTGGTVKPYEVSAHIEWLAMEISRLFNLDVSGIDLMFGETEDEYIVCEVNSSPGFKGLESALDVNIPQAIFQYIFFKLNKFPRKTRIQND